MKRCENCVYFDQDGHFGYCEMGNNVFADTEFCSWFMNKYAGIKN